jgi:hypothetical protein
MSDERLKTAISFTNDDESVNYDAVLNGAINLDQDRLASLKNMSFKLLEVRADVTFCGTPPIEINVENDLKHEKTSEDAWNVLGYGRV